MKKIMKCLLVGVIFLLSACGESKKESFDQRFMCNENEKEQLVIFKENNSYQVVAITNGYGRIVEEGTYRLVKDNVYEVGSKYIKLEDDKISYAMQEDEASVLESFSEAYACAKSNLEATMIKDSTLKNTYEVISVDNQKFEVRIDEVKLTTARNEYLKNKPKQVIEVSFVIKNLSDQDMKFVAGNFSLTNGEGEEGYHYPILPVELDFAPQEEIEKQLYFGFDSESNNVSILFGKGIVIIGSELSFHTTY